MAPFLSQYFTRAKTGHTQHTESKVCDVNSVLFASFVTHRNRHIPLDYDVDNNESSGMQRSVAGLPVLTFMTTEIDL